MIGPNSSVLKVRTTIFAHHFMHNCCSGVVRKCRARGANPNHLDTRGPTIFAWLPPDDTKTVALSDGHRHYGKPPEITKRPQTWGEIVCKHRRSDTPQQTEPCFPRPPNQNINKTEPSNHHAVFVMLAVLRLPLGSRLYHFTYFDAHKSGSSARIGFGASGGLAGIGREL